MKQFDKLIGSSSEEHPLGFFKVFFTTNFLQDFRNTFLPDKENPEDWINRAPISVNYEKEEYIIEYEVEKSGHAEEIIPGMSTWVTDETKWVVKTYSFNDQLSSLFNQQYLQSITLIEKILRDAPSKEKSEQLCILWIGQLRSYRVTALSKREFIRYPECARPLEALIRFLLDDYPYFSPNPLDDPLLLEIKNKKWNNGGYGLKDGLPRKLYDALASTPIMGSYIFFEEHFEDSTARKIAVALKNIAEGYHNKATTVKFFISPGKAHYILNKLRQHNPKMNWREIQNSGRILIQNRSFTEGAFNKYRSDIKKKTDQSINSSNLHDKMFEKEIDIIFEKFT